MAIDNINICGYCKEKNSTTLYPTRDFHENNFTINQCINCSTFFLAPRPSVDILNQAYSADYYGSTENKFSFPFIEGVLNYVRAGRSRRVIKTIGKNSKVLDIGCGNGIFLNFLHQNGNCEIHGTEFDSNSSLRASKVKNINLKVGGYNNDNYIDNYFDFVSMVHVFEHLTDPKEIIASVKQKLKPGGVLLISVPNIDSYQSKIFKGNWFHLDPPRHLFLIAPNTFISMMEKEGFQIKSTRFLSAEQNPYGYVQSILNLFTKKRDVLYEFFKGNKDYYTVSTYFQLAFFGLTFPFFIVVDLIESILKKSATVEFMFTIKK
jgi:2-polyprenyl-3-methyl-5-hydroxy-6-metoxy-1,4-benzoquinol methylase